MLLIKTGLSFLKEIRIANSSFRIKQESCTTGSFKAKNDTFTLQKTCYF